MNSISKYFLLVLMVISHNAYAQKYSYQNGILVLTNGDSIHCQIKTSDANQFLNSQRLIYGDDVRYKIDGDVKNIDKNNVTEILLHELIPDTISATRIVNKGPRTVTQKYNNLIYEKYTFPARYIKYSKPTNVFFAPN